MSSKLRSIAYLALSGCISQTSKAQYFPSVNDLNTALGTLSCELAGMWAVTHSGLSDGPKWSTCPD